MTDFPDIVGGAHAIAIQTDGKVVVGGVGALARYNTDGTLDSTFGGGDGVVAVVVADLAIQADGKIVVTGGGVLARLNTNVRMGRSVGATARWKQARVTSPCRAMARFSLWRTHP
jgi:hypothetical protein